MILRMQLVVDIPYFKFYSSLLKKCSIHDEFHNLMKQWLIDHT